ncbi:MAG TPA: extracellular solute-binding protein, partial [Fimbriimonas sp.]|nr:extracellular solute-binding protein [Fimbriimonas sp.]
MRRLLTTLLAPFLCATLPAQVDFWAVTGSVKDVAMYNKLARDFEQSSGIKVKVTPLAWGSFETKFYASMAAGIPPDIGMTNLGGPFNYGSVGGLVNFDKEFPEEAA